MMYLKEINVLSVAGKQYIYKLKSQRNLLLGLVIAQIISVLLSFAGTGMMNTGNAEQEVNLNMYSSEFTILYTIIWGMVAAIILTTRSNTNMDFTFVTNRLSRNLSNIGFLLSASILGSVTASLCGILIRVIIYRVTGNEFIIYESFFISPAELLIGMVSTIFYLFLFMSVGYLTGTLVQKNKIFAIILPALFIGLIFAATKQNSRLIIIQKIIGFFKYEDVLVLFILKAFFAASVLFYLAVLLSNRMEVRK